MPTSNINWEVILNRIAGKCEEDFNLMILIESSVIDEINAKVGGAISAVQLQHPNAAKVAGIVAFWIRKLKPLMIDPMSSKSFAFLNEYVSLKVGLAICEEYFDDSRKENIVLNPRILCDWIHSFRYHSHSPNSSVVSFEMLACNC